MRTQPGTTRRNVESGGLNGKYWRRVIFAAKHDALRTHCGIPTSGAIAARLWLEEKPPARTDRHAWRCSFDCACEMLGRDTAAVRAKFLAQIDRAWAAAAERHLQAEIYIRRAMVLAVLGHPPNGVARTIARQYMMPLVDAADYDDVAGVDGDDQYALYDQREDAAA